MKIRSATIENCKSYKIRESLALEDDITLLVGPNAGGKSNTMDILAIALRRFFLPTYTVNEGQDGGVLFQDIQQSNLFHPVSKFLDKNSDRETEPLQIQLVLEVGSTDVDNVKIILDNRDAFDRALSKYRNKPLNDLDFLESWSADMFAVGDTAEFTIDDDNITPGPGISEKFTGYLRHLGLFILLARDLPDVVLSPTFLYFSPYRSASPQDLNATLASDNYVNLLHRYYETTSRGTTSLIKLATVFFAEKKRRLEVRAADEAYGKLWREDGDVRLATRYMKRLGYEWNLRLVDKNRNTYEIELRKDNRKFLISQASSGKKEILNFLFGIFALRTRGGLLVIDEPELHLHPRWQAILRDLFRELAHTTENQFLVSTHSATFITPDTIANVRRVAKDEGGSTRLISLDGLGDAHSSKSLLHLVNSHNNERVFFADKVVLVEGIQDRLVFEELINRYREAAQIGEVIEVLEVHGKSNFPRYRDFLDGLRVPWLIVADLDYGVDLKEGTLENLVEVSYPDIDEKVIKSKKSKDRQTLSRALADAIQSNDTSALEEFWRYIEGRFARLKPTLTAEEEGQLRDALDDLRGRKIVILGRGEIEDYLPPEAASVDGTIELLEPESLLGWLESLPDDEGLAEIEDIVVGALQVPEEQRAEVRSQVLAKLMDEVTRDSTGEMDGEPEGEAGETAELEEAV